MTVNIGLAGYPILRPATDRPQPLGTATDLLIEAAHAGGIFHPGAFIVCPVLCRDLLLEPEVTEVTYGVPEGVELLQNARLSHCLRAETGTAPGLGVKRVSSLRRQR